MARIVAVASRTGRYGGPFDTAVRQAALYAEESHDVQIFAGSFRGDSPRNVPRLRTANVRHLLRLRAFVDVGSVAMIRLLWRGVRESDVVHVSYSRELLPVTATLFARVWQRSTILQPHGMLTSRRSRAHAVLDTLVMRRLIGRNMRAVALTDIEKEALEQWHPALTGRIDVVGNPPPVIAARRSSQTRVGDTVLFAARLHSRKRVMDFAHAAEEAAVAGSKGSYVVIGPDEGDLADLEAVALRSPNLTYAGATDSDGVLERLRESAIFVLCSANEPWGNVLVAALVMGKPVVVTSSSALSSWVAEYGAGEVIPDRSPSAIAAAVNRLLDPDAYALASAGARALSETRLSRESVKAGLSLSLRRVARAAGGSARG